MKNLSIKMTFLFSALIILFSSCEKNNSSNGSESKSSIDHLEDLKSFPAYAKYNGVIFTTNEVSSGINFHNFSTTGSSMNGTFKSYSTSVYVPYNSNVDLDVDLNYFRFVLKNGNVIPPFFSSVKVKEITSDYGQIIGDDEDRRQIELNFTYPSTATVVAPSEIKTIELSCSIKYSGSGSSFTKPWKETISF